MTFNILRSAHAEFLVTDIDAARSFYSDSLGFPVMRDDGDALYLGGLEERDAYSLILRKAKEPGLSFISFKVEKESDLEELAKLAESEGLPFAWFEKGTLPDKGRAVRIQDPGGIPVDFFADIEQRDWYLQKFHLHKGARIMRIDHFNCMVENVGKSHDWYTKKLGFHCSELTDTKDSPPQLWAVWLHRKQNVHDIAIMNGIGPRLHHLGFWASDRLSILDACDCLAATGFTKSIERGPGRHGISNAFFLYLRDPSGNRIEVYTGDYLITEWDRPPVRWDIDDPIRQTFWGHIPPRSWFDEASLVKNVKTGEFMPTTEPKLVQRPQYVT
jgi:catechol 2,3-dioxygenase